MRYVTSLVLLVVFSTGIHAQNIKDQASASIAACSKAIGTSVDRLETVQKRAFALKKQYEDNIETINTLDKAGFLPFLDKIVAEAASANVKAELDEAKKHVRIGAAALSRTSLQLLAAELLYDQGKYLDAHTLATRMRFQAAAVGEVRTILATDAMDRGDLAHAAVLTILKTGVTVVTPP